MSEIEKIGTALFGRSWMAQVGHYLVNANGESISRQTVQSWHNRDNLAPWAKEQLKDIAQTRLKEIQEINEYLEKS
ncbi:hypothetical protein [Moraxella sp. ZY210820]|uniref:hypothetical protein n=1 Tax=Moraxella sp. ZY210820 TaxID=2904123 RepID=UPI0027319FE0|nr:hypothetical protein [Moraxella sp. ZY210820]WLF84821.1 hypothetical protein LU301_04990 [Moraxella sp. ZY210820]